MTNKNDTRDKSTSIITKDNILPITVATNGLTATVGLIIGAMRESRGLISIGLLPLLIIGGLISILGYFAVVAVQRNRLLMGLSSSVLVALPILTATSFWLNFPLKWDTFLSRIAPNAAANTKLTSVKPLHQEDAPWQSEGLQYSMAFLSLVQAPQWKSEYVSHIPAVNASLNSVAILTLKQKVDGHIQRLLELERELDSGTKERIVANFPRPTTIPSLYNFLGYDFYMLGVLDMDDAKADPARLQKFSTALQYYLKAEEANTNILKGELNAGGAYDSDQLEKAKRTLEGQGVTLTGGNPDLKWGIAICRSRIAASNPLSLRDEAIMAFRDLVQSKSTFRASPENWDFFDFDRTLATDIWPRWRATQH